MQKYARQYSIRVIEFPRETRHQRYDNIDFKDLFFDISFPNPLEQSKANLVLNNSTPLNSGDKKLILDIDKMFSRGNKTQVSLMNRGLFL